MTSPTVDDSLWLLSRARGPALANRLLIGVCPLMATLCTTMAAGQSLLIVSASIALLGAACAVLPDGHLGLIVVVVLAVEWLTRVGDEVSAWSIGTAAFIGLFHLSAALAGAAPAGADLTSSVARQWLLRALAAIAPAPLTWVVAAVLDGTDLGGAAPLVVAALLLLAIGGVWSAGLKGVAE